MATLKLKKKPAKDSSPKADRPPVRGTGSGVRKRPTLAEAQVQRDEREARYQEQLRQRFGDAPPPAYARRGDDAPGPARGQEERGAPARRRPDDNRGASTAFEGRRSPPSSSRDPQQRDRPPSDRQRSDEPRQQRARAGASDHRQDRPQGGHAPQQQRSGGPNTAFGGPRQAPSRGGPRDDAPSYRGDRDRNDSAPRPAYRADPRDEAPRRGRRDEQRPQAPANPDPGLRREDQRRRGGGHTQHGGPDRPDPRQRAQPRHARDDDDEDDGPQHAEQQPGSMRLSKRMSELGMSSRREADEWIPKGWVRVDGRVVKELGSRVMPGQHISIDAKARNQQAARVTVLINKPVGYVSGQAEDGYEPALVLVTEQNQWREDRSSIRFLREHLRNLAPAGRLDIDSVGLLVLTQDGRIAKQLIGEDSEVEKEYLVRVQTKNGEPLPDDQLDLLRHGLELDGQALRPAHVEWVNDDQLRFVLREGKKRQIRRMCEAVGLDVLGLKRVRIGRVMLGDLPPGQWRYLRGDEGFLDKGGEAAPSVAPAPAPALATEPDQDQDQVQDQDPAPETD